MAEMLLLNPRKRRKATKRRTTAKRRPAAKRRTYARNPVATRRRRVSRKLRRASTGRRYRRNPIRKMGLMSQFTDAALAASGAIGLDVLMGVLPVPAALNTGMARHATKAVGAVLMSMAASAVLSKGTANKLGQGALTVVFHDAMREQLTNFAPALTLGEAAIPYYPSDIPEPGLGYYQAGLTVDESYNPMGEYVDQGMGEYVNQY